VDLVHRLAARHPDLVLTDSADGVRAAAVQGRIGSLLGAEGGHCLDGSLDVLRDLRARGVRYLTLTHDANTPWADSATDEPEHGGLTAFGRDVVREMNRIGMIVDLSHTAPTTMRDALDTTDVPVLFTHSCCRALTDHPRNVPDDVLAALAANGGVCMITFVAPFVAGAASGWGGRVAAAMAAEGLDPADPGDRDAHRGPPPPDASLLDVVAHLDHAREVAGVDHVGIGADFDGTTDLPVGLRDVSTYPALFAALLERGWSDEDCTKLAGGNVLRVLQAVEESCTSQ
ncbi:MAG: dipeptidase, partial [Pseudonocardiales bacterium]|nr:dipeptidase [Pseudonocardiales bacterium]